MNLVLSNNNLVILIDFINVDDVLFGPDWPIKIWSVSVKGTTIWLSITTLKTGSHGVMLKSIKDLSVFSSLPIGFKVEWHNSQSDKWYQSHGHGFESRECHCEGGIVGGTTIWLPTTTLKTNLHGVMLKVIKDLSMSFSSPIGFEVKWHNSRSNSFNSDWGRW